MTRMFGQKTIANNLTTKAMLRRIRQTQIGVAVGAVLAVWLCDDGTPAVNPLYPIIWAVFTYVAFMNLKCVHCGKGLLTTPPFGSRVFGLHTCAHCGQKQPP